MDDVSCETPLPRNIQISFVTLVLSIALDYMDGTSARGQG